MQIISTTDTSREGTDCYICESVTLVEQFGIYSVIRIQQVTGWAEREEVCVLCTTTSGKAAKKVYRDNGGRFDAAISYTF